jgi:hypothetical protein
VVGYVPIIVMGRQIEYFNLEFGDYNIRNDQLDDLAVTDNGDMRKVLKTVASTLEYFFDRFPGKMVRIDGSDQRRHAYYHKLIRDYYKFITPLYNVKGSINGSLRKFKAGMEYDFIVVTKR